MKFIKKHFFIFRFSFSLILLLISLVIKYQFPNYEYTIALPLTLVGYALMSYDMYIKVFKSIKSHDFFDEVSLTIIASIAATSIGEFVDGLAVVMFFQLGEHFEDYALDSSRKSIKSIMELRPDYIRLIRNGKEEVVNPSEAKVDDIFIVKPGEIVPLDGIIINGKSNLNTSSITGESLPREAKENDSIISGVINLDSPLTIKATKSYGESTVSKILDMVENASSKKTKSEKFITKFSKIYTPIVISIAFIIAIIPPLFFGIKDGNWNTWSDWIYRGASMLVISCPCAIVISIPMSYVVSIGVASKQKILIKGSTYLELIAKSNSIYLDKTGTITEGKFKIASIKTEKNIDKEELINLAQIAESFSNHPIAKAIVANRDCTDAKTKIKEYIEVNGKGISCLYNGKLLLAGNEKLLKDNKIKFIKNDEIGTIIYVAYNKKFYGSLVIRDTLKENTVEAIKLFKKHGIKQVTMLTGDNSDIAKSIAAKAGITHYESSLLPIDKTKFIEKAKEKGEITMFVGDGINDAPSLVISDIGISMGSIGSDSAIEASDIVIMDDDLRRISYLKSLAKLNKFVVYYNLIFAIGIKVLTLFLNMFGLLHEYAIIAAIFADVGVTFICCINSLLISLKKK
ncbi:MAG: heavy metal translocating P-type ATPase [Bacilli bacterium]